MTVKHIDAVVLQAADLAATLAFYRAVGLPLEEEDHGEGPVHHACELGSLHFAIYPGQESGRAPGRRQSGGTLVGFQVDALEAAVENARAVGAEVIQPIETVPWGRRALLRDPDGRVVELNQAV